MRDVDMAEGKQGVVGRMLGREKPAEVDFSSVPKVLDVRSFDEHKTLSARIEELVNWRGEVQSRLEVVAGELAVKEDRSQRILDLLHNGPRPFDTRAKDEARRHELAREQSELKENLEILDGAIAKGREDLSCLEYDLARAAVAPVNEWHKRLITMMAFHVRELLRLSRAEAKARRAVERFEKPGRLLAGGGEAAPEFSRGEQSKGVPALGWIGRLMREGYLAEDFDMSGTGWGGKDD
jgi:hypothetical protein